jgi:hypothetical protein
MTEKLGVPSVEGCNLSMQAWWVRFLHKVTSRLDQNKASILFYVGILGYTYGVKQWSYHSKGGHIIQREIIVQEQKVNG